MTCGVRPRMLSATLIVAVLLTTTAFAQSQVVNAKIETRRVTRGLAAEIQAVADRGAAAWVGYRTPTLPGPQHMCESRRTSRVMLEPATELTILIRVEDRRVIKLQTVTPDCEVDAGGLPVVWLEGVSAADSAAWLITAIQSTDGRAQRESQIVQRAIAALVWHAGDEPLKAVVELARNDRRADVRGQALFWLSQRAGQQAVAAIRSAVDDDPETDVKRKAVFALSRLPGDEGVPLLIEIARTNRNAQVRKQAMFWLGQSRDPRAVGFFEEVLK
jgi:HEAT repeat protein